MIHLSYLEFLCAASILRPDVNITEELAKIQSEDRFKAVIKFMIGFFNRNHNIQFLNTCKSLKENFLHLLKNEKHKDSVQTIFRSILNREFHSNCHCHESCKPGLKLKTCDETYPMSFSNMSLLVEAMEVSSTKIDEFYLQSVEVRRIEDAIKFSTEPIDDMYSTGKFIRKQTDEEEGLSKLIWDAKLHFLCYVLAGVKVNELQIYKLFHEHCWAQLQNNAPSFNYVKMLTIKDPECHSEYCVGQMVSALSAIKNYTVENLVFRKTGVKHLCYIRLSLTCQDWKSEYTSYETLCKDTKCIEEGKKFINTI